MPNFTIQEAQNMRLKILFLTLFIGLAILGCKQEPKKTEPEAPSKMEEVMAVHDEVMPKMSTIGKLVAELKPMVDSTETGLKCEKAMTDLQIAHKSMMDWMHGFGTRFDSDEILNGKELSPQKQEWLLEEEVKVNEMRDQVNSSIENAEDLLASMEEKKSH